MVSHSGLPLAWMRIACLPVAAEDYATVRWRKSWRKFGASSGSAMRQHVLQPNGASPMERQACLYPHPEDTFERPAMRPRMEVFGTANRQSSVRHQISKRQHLSIGQGVAGSQDVLPRRSPASLLHVGGDSGKHEPHAGVDNGAVRGS